MQRLFLIIASLLLLLFATTTLEAQNCCIPRLGEDEEVARLVGSIQSATILLAAVPYVLLGSGTLLFFLRWRTRPTDNDAE